jgi:uncharacterized membrane protein YeaQ/YmgE (transglycosylase-associated protein family)
MGRSTYCYVSGVIFGLVAALHLLRFTKSWPVQIGSISIPELASVLGALVGASLCLWAFRVAKK